MLGNERFKLGQLSGSIFDRTIDRLVGFGGATDNIVSKRSVAFLLGRQ